MPAHPEAPAAKRAPRVHVAASPLPVIVLLAVLLLPGCDRGKVEKLEAVNTKLKSELEMVQEQVKELAAKQRQEAAAREQEEAKRKLEAAELEVAEAKKRQATVEQELKAKTEQEAKKLQAIEKCFEQIELRMKALVDTPRSFSYQTDAERRQTETRLKTVASGKKEEMGEVLIELKTLGFDSVSDVQSAIDSFITDYGQIVFYKRLSADYSTFNSAEASIQAQKSLEYLSRAFSTLKGLQQMKRAAAKGENTLQIQTAFQSGQNSDDYGTHKFNSNGFCEKCGWEKDFLVRENKTDCSPKKD